MQDLIKIVVTSLLSSGVMSGVVGLIVYKVQRRDRLKDEKAANDTALSLMVRGLCHDKILYLTDKAVARKGITTRERATLTSIYEPYHDAGGNGDCKEGFEACEKLETITEDEARRRDILIRSRDYGITGRREHNVQE